MIVAVVNSSMFRIPSIFHQIGPAVSLQMNTLSAHKTLLSSLPE